MAELFDLLADISEESVARPATYHHDAKGGDIVECHGHGTPRSDRVGPEVSLFDTEVGITD